VNHLHYGLHTALLRLSGDIVIRRGAKDLYFDDCDGGPFDAVTVNEGAADPPEDLGPPTHTTTTRNTLPEIALINTATSLSLEATYFIRFLVFRLSSKGPTLRPKSLLRRRPDGAARLVWLLLERLLPQDATYTTGLGNPLKVTGCIARQIGARNEIHGVGYRHADCA
jgi:hypothetical protein